MRKAFFWAHLVAGVIAGICILVMCFTGVVLAFEKQIVAWSERDARVAALPPDPSQRRSVDELARRVEAFQPTAKPQSIVISSDPAAAVVFTLGRDAALYANPYTGEVRAPASTRVHDFMHAVEAWHRWLALGGDQRAIGKAINGACNLAFLFLAVSGLYLWWPRSLSWRSVRAITVVNLRAAGRARDFNWHTSIGFWCAPILLVLTLTALPISYRWAANGIHRLVGEVPPGPGARGAVAMPAGISIERPANDARPLSLDDLIAVAMRHRSSWETITVRLVATASRLGPAAGSSAAQRSQVHPSGEGTGRREGRQEFGRDGVRRADDSLAPVSVVIKEPGTWPRTATTTLWMDPYTGELLKREGFGDLATGRQIRSWTRFLHTGEAVGWWGQALAGAASLGGCFLVYTGFALTWRRLRRKCASKLELSSLAHESSEGIR